MTTRTRPAARVFCMVVAMLAASSGTPAAQDASPVRRGTDVRLPIDVLDRRFAREADHPVSRDAYVAYVREGRVSGTVLSSGADSLVVRLSRGGVRLAIPWQEIGWMERRSGSSTRARLIGTLAGAAAVGVPLGVLGASVWEEVPPINELTCAWGYPGCRGKNRWNSRTEQGIALGLGGAVVGGGIGFLAVSLGLFDRWHPATLPARVSVVSGTDGVGLAASVRH